MAVADIEAALAEVRAHLWKDTLQVAEIRRALAESKSTALERTDQAAAKQIWCLETTLEIQTNYIDAFQELKDGKHYSAWCKLERVEIGALHGAKHCGHDWDRFHVPFILTQTEKLQALFPYRHFISPAMLHKRAKCSICGAEIALRRPCGHTRGEIYNGELCMRVIVESEILEISITTNPVQKYSVVFPGGDDQPDPYDYALIDYVVRGLRTPFDDWTATWSTLRHPHSSYSHIPPPAPCPCGSGRTYAECCLREKGVLKPHVIVQFSSPPPADLPRLVLPRAPQNRPPRQGGQGAS